MGLNGNQTIKWKVHPINNSDVEPSLGKLQFSHNQTEVNNIYTRYFLIV